MEQQDLEDVYQKTLDAAAKQLSYRALSEKALREKLLAKGYPADAAEWALAWLTERGLLSDESFAAGVVRSYGKRGYGEMRIRQELARRGVAREDADGAMTAFSPDRTQMTALLEKRLHGDLADRREIDKAVAALARRGYLWEDIRAALRDYGTPREDDE